MKGTFSNDQDMWEQFKCTINQANYTGKETLLF